MSTSLMIAMPVVGAALPIVVTQVSSDKDLRALGRAALKYVLALPLLSVGAIIAAAALVA